MTSRANLDLSFNMSSEGLSVWGRCVSRIHHCSWNRSSPIVVLLYW